MAKEVDVQAAVSRAKAILALLKTTSLTVLGPAVAACVLWAVCEAWGVPETIAAVRENYERANDGLEMQKAGVLQKLEEHGWKWDYATRSLVRR